MRMCEAVVLGQEHSRCSLRVGAPTLHWSCFAIVITPVDT